MEKLINKFKNFSYTHYLIILVIIFGCILRTITYTFDRPLWHDECSLALSIVNRGIFDYFRPLEHYQCAPPIFMILTNLITKIAGINEYSLKLLPFMCSIVSLPLFYLLSKQYIKNKISLITINFLFCINYQLIRYSQEFKQYSTDVFITILALYILNKIDIANLNFKKIITISIFIATLPIISFPSAFIIASFLFIQFILNKQIKNTIVFVIPTIIVSYIYYLTTARTSLNTQLDMGMYMWNYGFLRHDFSNILSILKINLDFFFNPNKFTLIGIVLLLSGFVYSFFKDNKNKLLSLIFLFALIASYLNIYPLYERTSIYLIPIILLLIFSMTDKITIKLDFKTFGLWLFVVLYFVNYIKFDYYTQLFNKNLFTIENPKTLLNIIKNNYEPNQIFAYNDASDSEYKFYSNYLKFKPKRYVKITSIENDKYKYFETLNMLPKNNIYWFYYPFEFNKTPVTKYLNEWLKDKNVLYEYNEKNSFIYKVKL